MEQGKFGRSLHSLGQASGSCPPWDWEREHDRHHPWVSRIRSHPHQGSPGSTSPSSLPPTSGFSLPLKEKRSSDNTGDSYSFPPSLLRTHPDFSP